MNVRDLIRILGTMAEDTPVTFYSLSVDEELKEVELESVREADGQCEITVYEGWWNTLWEKK